MPGIQDNLVSAAGQAGAQDSQPLALNSFSEIPLVLPGDLRDLKKSLQPK